MKHFYHNCIQSAFFFFISLTLPNYSFGNTIQDDTVKVQHVYNVPQIDGILTDACWDSASWQVIDQVWIPYGAHIDSSDFYGRYKVVWSSTTNLLYLLVETTDNIFVDGYIYRSSPSGNNYPDFDILEVFIDENRSKGKHVFDGTGQVGIDWGYNAENAFSYHIAAMAPIDGEVTYDKDVCDIAGTGWDHEWIPNYASHFPEFALKKNGNQYTWEFSLKVYKDTYDPQNPSDSSLVLLSSGKVMGLDLAYCDDDTPMDIKRESFIGSSYVTAAKYNDHWMDAGDFGMARLETVKLSTIVNITEFKTFTSNYSASTGQLKLFLPAETNAIIKVQLYNLMGSAVFGSLADITNGIAMINLSSQNLASGIYLLSVLQGQKRYTTKIMIN